MQVAVIGAGPAGITAAYELAKKGVEVHVYEASDTVGGLARSFRLWDQTVDLGPHRFFSSHRRINELWLEVVGRDYRMVNRLTRIYYRGRFFYYPLKPFDVLSRVGPIEAARCGFSYIANRLSPIEQNGTFENWVVNRFGRRLFEIFFKTYSEKLWGISCQEIDADFAAQRIKKLSLFEAVKNAFFAGRGNQHKTLVDQFAYPVEGTGMVYRRMADFVRGHGGQVFLNSPVQRVLTKDGRACALEFPDGGVRSYDQIVSSMPISLLVTRLPDVPDAVRGAASSLKFRNTILVYLNVDAVDLFPDQWLYIHSDDMLTGRITNFRNWLPSLYGESRTTILVMELWANDDDALWSESDEQLIARGKDEIRRTGLIRDAAILDGHVHRIKRCYPVYERGYKEKLKPVEEYLSSIKGLQAIGRYGAFKYNNQDHSIYMGILAAENIVAGTHHNLWEINTDYESYQEEAQITEAGLSAVAHEA
ncbi:MAG: FAD-dependent oxidoreductase [Candidatus Hydrogenedentes bacterium]|nr:FAD-dependent oxidoreductase [Candidatus Hydrogenedentota bacterium]